jgi:hypothetical protein
MLEANKDDKDDDDKDDKDDKEKCCREFRPRKRQGAVS